MLTRLDLGLLAAAALTLSACAGDDNDVDASIATPDAQVQDASTPDAGMPHDAGPPDSGIDPREAVADRLFQYLAGTFDSTAQAAADARYFEIQLKACAVDAPDIGERVLYVEQAVVSSANRPYRQRIYVVEFGEGEQDGVSRVYTVANEASWIGACDEATPRTVTAAEITERSGCAVYLTWSEADAQFAGSTRGNECSSNLQGATYATSEVVMTETEVRSWDRGYDDQDVQVWGAEAGPYIFVRKP